MPRNGSGVASVVNTFVPLATADANAVNANFTDMANMITDSLPRDGQAGMTGQFLATSGTAGEPGISWNADPDTGIRRPAGDQQAIVCGGADVATFTPTGATLAGGATTNATAPTTGDHLTNKTYVDAQVATAAARMPSGAVTMHAANTAPTGWLECDGAAVSRTTYAALFTAIGTTWGVGDGSTTFNVPDLRGEFVRGWDHGKGTDAGRAFASAQQDSIQNITGGFSSRRTTAASPEDLADWTGAFYDNGTGGSDLGTSVGGAVLRRITGFDASRVVRASTETRPRSIALMYIIKI